MPGKVGVKIKAGRNLPVMDRSSDTTDAYVEIKLGTVTHKTDVCRKSLNPQWNTDWFRFELDDAELQDEPLQIRLMDHDTYSANDAIGKVNISLNPLCLENAGQSSQGKGAVMSGWIPVFDTMHGIRGEVNIIVKVDLFSDSNKFRQSSCGVQFFHSPCVPHGYRAQIIHGFVEELVVNDDPEYQWIDKIRTPRASNEARQVVFLKLSGQVQRKIGLKAINLGANAVIGYTQCFDLEGDVGVVGRGIGTAVTLIKIHEAANQPVLDATLIEERTLKYIEFLKGGHSKRDESSRSKFDYDSFGDSDTSAGLVYKILGIEDPNVKCLTKSPNVILKRQWKPKDTGTVIQEETGSEADSFKAKETVEAKEKTKVRHRLRHQVKRIAKSSKKLLLKTRNDSDDSKSPTSSVSDVSFSESARSSLSDLGNLIRFRKRNRFSRSVSDGSGMASLLVSSVVRGPTLGPISEAQDSARSTPVKSNKSDNKSESMNNLSMLPENTPSLTLQGGHAKAESMCNLGVSKEQHRYSPKKLLKTPNESISSISSISTFEEGFSDEDEEEEEETTTPNEVVIVDADTVSMVVKSVLAQESMEKDEDNWIQPGSTQDDGESNKSRSYIHKSQSVPMRLSIDSIGMPKYAPHIEEEWIQPGSTVDEPEFEDKERRGSLLHDLRENLTETLHHLQEHMHLPHSEGKVKLIKHGIIESAMETMLVDKAHILCVDEFSNPPIEMPVNQNLNAVAEKRRGSLDSIAKILHLPFGHKSKKHDEIKNNEGMIANAMKSILMEPFALSDEITDYENVNKFYDNFKHNESAAAAEHEREDPNCDQDRQEKNENVSNQNTGPNVSALTNNMYNVEHTQNDESFSYYSSQPELIINESQSLVASPVDKPFISLTNLTVNHKSYSSLQITPILKICPSTPTPTDSDTSYSGSPNPSFLSTQSVYLDTANTCTGTHYTKPMSSSKSDTNLIINCTNNAAMLAPSTPLYLTHHRSSSELVSTTGVVSTSAAGAKLGSSPGKPIAIAGNGHARTESMTVKMGQSPSKGAHTDGNNSLGNKDSTAIYRRSSDSDLSITPKGNSLCVASERLVAATALMRINAPNQLKSANPENMDMLEYPFLTMAKYPKGFIMHLGATVAARSVKLLERVPNPDEPETRDSWWTELRMEIRSHARALGCNVILGYSEVTTISDDVCVLSATGTAAVINMSYNGSSSQADIAAISKRDIMVSSLDDKDVMKVDQPAPILKEISSSYTGPSKSTPINNTASSRECSLCHIPYSSTSVPFNIKMKKCAICKKGRVPDVLLATIEIPESLSITGRGCFMQAQVVRVKRDLRSESNAKEISDGLPFLEYELHRLLINKLKAKGMNAIFGLKAHVAIGERMIALIATGTAVFLTALPPPTVPKIVAGNSWTDKARLNDLQKSLQETYERNREIYQLKCLDPDMQNGKQSDTDDSEDETLEMDLNAGTKDTCVLEVDDIEDLEIISLLMEPCPPEGFHVVNTQTVPGLQDLEVVRNLQMFTQVWRAKFSVGQTVAGFPKHFQRLLQTVYFKLRSMIPCAICDLRFRLDLPESDEIQVLVTGMALGLGDPVKLSKMRRKTLTNSSDSNSNGNSNGGSRKEKQEDELMFSLDEDQNMESVLNPTYLQAANYGTHSLKLRKSSPSRTKFSSMRMTRHLPLNDRYGVDITPLSYVPGGKIEKYLGNLNFFFIRESTSIREIGGISGFVHSFITELLAVIRAHIAALGGNAMVSFYMTELILVDNQHKNQGQCLISIGGDVVSVSYYSDD